MLEYSHIYSNCWWEVLLIGFPSAPFLLFCIIITSIIFLSGGGAFCNGQRIQVSATDLVSVATNSDFFLAKT